MSPPLGGLLVRRCVSIGYSSRTLAASPGPVCIMCRRRGALDSRSVLLRVPLPKQATRGCIRAEADVVTVTRGHSEPCWPCYSRLRLTGHSCSPLGASWTRVPTGITVLVRAGRSPDVVYACRGRGSCGLQSVRDGLQSGRRCVPGGSECSVASGGCWLAGLLSIRPLRGTHKGSGQRVGRLLRQAKGLEPGCGCSFGRRPELLSQRLLSPACRERSGRGCVAARVDSTRGLLRESHVTHMGMLLVSRSSDCGWWTWFGGTGQTRVARESTQQILICYCAEATSTAGSRT